MARTRSSKASRPRTSSKETETPDSKHQLQEQDPPKLTILPSGISSNARILTLKNPRTSKPNRYFFCPVKGIYEFTCISAPKTSPRSVLLSPIPQENESTNQQDDNSRGFVTKDAEFLIATPIDPLFLMLPILFPFTAASKNPSGPKLLRSLEDLLDDSAEFSANLKAPLSHTAFQQNVETRIEKVCDIVEAGDEKMYRLNTEKLAKLLLQKAEVMVARGLPESMDEKFVKRALDVPFMAVQREESSGAVIEEAMVTKTSEESSDEKVDSQSTIMSTTISVSTTNVMSKTSATTTSIVNDDTEPQAPPEIVHLLRLRIALSFMLESYVPKHITKMLEAHLSSPNNLTDFARLEKHLKRIVDLRAEAFAARSIADFGRKRGFEVDEEVEDRAEKKRRLQEEEKKKKANESRGVRDLKKVNTKGMKKMSDFFTKAPATKKK
ncbi:MAG: hypothetical protein M1834_006822 [Cirrosporium novae-zelandiae]|nr:MAG: hypothetical protein M1834_006822 [Cirrosporium novae-zelandiae]